MSRTIASALIAFALIGGTVPGTAHAGTAEVVGVEPGDMLKMRAGPGTGYKVILGLPNGTMLRTHSCDRVGGTPWCKVSLKQARGLKGYVAGHYLRGQ